MSWYKCIACRHVEEREPTTAAPTCKCGSQFWQEVELFLAGSMAQALEAEHLNAMDEVRQKVLRVLKGGPHEQMMKDIMDHVIRFSTERPS